MTHLTYLWSSWDCLVLHSNHSEITNQLTKSSPHHEVYNALCFISVNVSFNLTTYTVTEGTDDVANLVLVRSGKLSRTVVVTFTTAAETATAGSDYHDPVVTTVTFEDSVTSASYPVPILNDNVIEDTETFTVTLNTSESYVNIVDGTATVTISDDDSELFYCNIHSMQRKITHVRLAGRNSLGVFIIDIKICGSAS